MCIIPSVDQLHRNANIAFGDPTTTKRMFRAVFRGRSQGGEQRDQRSVGDDIRLLTSRPATSQKPCEVVRRAAKHFEQPTLSACARTRYSHAPTRLNLHTACRVVRNPR